MDFGRGFELIFKGRLLHFGRGFELVFKGRLVHFGRGFSNGLSCLASISKAMPTRARYAPASPKTSEHLFARSFEFIFRERSVHFGHGLEFSFELAMV